MKQILVPTDFSANADRALDYAMVLAEKEKMGIILLHAFYINLISPDFPAFNIDETKTGIEKKATKKLNQLLKKIEQKNIPCEIINKEGSVVKVISESVKEKQPAMVVMGTKGATGLKEILIGSNTAQVIGNALCPVIAIPNKSSFKGISNITYATDLQPGDVSIMLEIVKLAKIFNANINVLHIYDEECIEESERYLLDKFKKDVARKTDYKKINYHMIYGHYEEKIVEDFLLDNASDLLVISIRYRILFEKIFVKNMAKELSYHSTIPLMVFHYEMENALAN